MKWDNKDKDDYVDGLIAESLTDKHREFIELEKFKEAVKAWHEKMQAALKDLTESMGVDHYFQDEDGTVYKLVDPAGTFVHFDKYGYQRTRRDGEERGSLSVTEATKAGFKF